MEGRVSRLEGTYEQVADRLNVIDQRLGALEFQMGQNFRWLMGAIGGSWLTLMIALLSHR